MAKVNLDTAARLDIVCRKGDSFSLSVEFDTVVPNHEDSNIEWLMEVRENDTTDTITQGTFSITRSSSNTKLLTIQNGAETMAALNSGLYVYDLQVKNTDPTPYIVKTYLYGTFEIVEDITVTT